MWPGWGPALCVWCGRARGTGIAPRKAALARSAADSEQLRAGQSPSVESEQTRIRAESCTGSLCRLNDSNDK
jgi:hypothetical protein